MIQNIILAITLVVAFLLSVSSFLLGLRMGKSISEGKLPTVTINPVKKAIEAVEQHKEVKKEKEVTDTLEDIMGATKESMLQAIKSEVK